VINVAVGEAAAPWGNERADHCPVTQNPALAYARQKFISNLSRCSLRGDRDITGVIHYSKASASLWAGFRV
jgi:hypothetical protein